MKITMSLKTSLKIFGTIFIVLVLLSNYWAIGNWFFSALFNEKWNEYTTIHGKFTADEFPEKGRDFARVERMFADFKKSNPQTSDTILYRTFSKNPLKFWHWHEYIFNKGYRLPYKPPSEIKKD
jgi:hypothetical protein